MRYKHEWLLRLLSIIIFLAGNLVYGQDDSLVVQSAEAEYNGQEISLMGQVSLQHELGHISARQLTIRPIEDQEKKRKFSFLKLKDEVLIEARDGSTLCCQEAEINYADLKGVFFGNQETPDVIYTNKEVNRNQNSQASLVVKSHQMRVNLTRQYDVNSQSNKSSIHQIQADQFVRAYYNQDYLVMADHAFYQKLPNQSVSTFPLEEKLFLYVNEEEGTRFCQVTNQNGDQLQANQITMDLINRQMTLDQPRGIIRVNQDEQPISFSARYSIWNEKEQTLLLQNDIKLYQKGLGQLATNNEMTIYQYLLNGKKNIRSIVSNAETELTYLDESSQTNHKILCHGPLIIDHEHFQIWMHSPVDEQGVVISGKQVYFENMAGDIYADQMLLNYTWDHQTLVPTQLTMLGHVQIFSRFDGHLQESSSVLQYVLADKVVFFPREEEMILTGQSQRVLLFDKVNNLQMSAPALKIHVDQTTKKRSIQGIGDVRFTFIEQEFNQFKQNLHLNEKNP